MKRYEKEFYCEKCGILFTRLWSDKRSPPKRSYCSVECKRSDKNSFLSEWTDERRKRVSEKLSGENNPNYNKRWSEEKKKEASIQKKQFYKEHPEVAFECGKSNRGVKFTKERVAKMHANRSRESYSRSHTIESRERIGVKSKEKWTEDYKKKHKEKMISLGYWVDPLEQPYREYYKNSNWCENMVAYFSPEEEESFRSFGFYNRNNPKGMVRDHIVSRKTGYSFNIPYFIIRHPANMQLITHGENISKGFKDRSLPEDVTFLMVESLLDRIEKYDLIWKEQDICVNFIKERRSI